MGEPFSPTSDGVWPQINGTDWPAVAAEFEQARNELVSERTPGSQVGRIQALHRCADSLEKMLTILRYEIRQTVHDVVFYGERGAASDLARQLGIDRRRLSESAQRAAHERLAGKRPFGGVLAPQ